jgi:hypothetical protein
MARRDRFGDHRSPPATRLLPDTSGAPPLRQMTDALQPSGREPAALLGRWRLLRADTVLDFAPGVRMEFQAGGRLLYGFDVGERREVITLCYRVEQDVLHTGNPATTHEVSTHFAFGPGDVLIFDFAGARAWFVRELAR